MSSDGNRVAVGTLRDSVYIFDGAGTQLMKLTAADGVSASPSSGDWFGESVAMNCDGNRLAIGADFDGDKGSNSGSVYLFELPPATSTNTETLTSTLTSTTETSLTTEESSTATVTATETTTLTSSTETSLTESSTATEMTTPHTTTEISATDLIVESSGCDRGAACTSLAAIAAAVIASLVL